MTATERLGTAPGARVCRWLQVPRAGSRSDAPPLQCFDSVRWFPVFVLFYGSSVLGQSGPVPWKFSTRGAVGGLIFFAGSCETSRGKASTHVGIWCHVDAPADIYNAIGFGGL